LGIVHKIDTPVGELTLIGRLKDKDTKEFEERPLTRPFQLPSAMGVGNVEGMIAQAYPNATALGGMMGMQPGGAPPGMGEAPNVFSVRPRLP
jgi:chorismate synthase